MAFEPVSYTHLDVYKRQEEADGPLVPGGEDRGRAAVYGAGDQRSAGRCV